MGCGYPRSSLALRCLSETRWARCGSGMRSRPWRRSGCVELPVLRLGYPAACGILRFSVGRGGRCEWWPGWWAGAFSATLPSPQCTWHDLGHMAGPAHTGTAEPRPSTLALSSVGSGQPLGLSPPFPSSEAVTGTERPCGHRVERSGVPGGELAAEIVAMLEPRLLGCQGGGWHCGCQPSGWRCAQDPGGGGDPDRWGGGVTCMSRDQGAAPQGHRAHGAPHMWGTPSSGACSGNSRGQEVATLIVTLLVP